MSEEKEKKRNPTTEKIDLFNNPLVDAARRNMTPEQQAEYKRIGEYLYSNENFRLVETCERGNEATTDNLAMYANEALKAGLDPQDLSDEEIQALIKVYGVEWYEKYGFEKSHIREPTIRTSTAEEVLNEIKKRQGLSRQQRRFFERKLAKAQGQAKQGGKKTG